MTFHELNEAVNLSCSNVTDKFSINNNKAKLKYKIGMASYSEMNLLNNNTVRKTGANYWVFSPNQQSTSASLFSVSTSGTFTNPSVSTNTFGARPVISVSSVVAPSSGTGTMIDPYIIDTSGN